MRGKDFRSCNASRKAPTVSKCEATARATGSLKLGMHISILRLGIMDLRLLSGLGIMDVRL